MCWLLVIVSLTKVSIGLPEKFLVSSMRGDLKISKQMICILNDGTSGILGKKVGCDT